MRTRHRLTISIIVAVAASWLVCTTALAHVTIEPPAAPQGSYATLAFRVPNERPAASTVKIRVQFPQDHPVASVSVRPVGSWSVKVDKTPIAPQPGKEGNQITEAVNTITWEGGQIKPDQFEEFEVALGPLPDGVDRLYFPTIQTYDNGEDVAWIEKPSAAGGSSDLQFPAPELALVAGASGAQDAHGASVGAAGAATTAAARSASSAAAPAASTTTSSDSTTATTIAGLSLGVALVALVLGIVATGLLLRARRVTASPDTT